MIYGIVLAAGRGRRIGTPKALLSLHGSSFLERAVSCFGDRHRVVLVVVNPEVGDQLPPPRNGESRILNFDPDDQSGMFGSVQLGVAAAWKLGATGVVLLPVDHPLVTGTDVQAVADAVERGAAVAIATHGKRRGHPMGMNHGVMDEVLRHPLKGTLKEIVRRDPARVVEVPGSAGVIEGVNTREDLERVFKLTFR